MQDLTLVRVRSMVIRVEIDVISAHAKTGYLILQQLKHDTIPIWLNLRHCCIAPVVPRHTRMRKLLKLNPYGVTFRYDDQDIEVGMRS